jgi:AAA+ ATPase superfamily predicted ATPase
MGWFVGRERELAYLEGLYAQEGLKTCAVYGRKQIGKSALLKKFCEGKRSISIRFLDLSEYDNLLALRSAVSRLLGREMPGTESFPEIMRMLADACRREKTVVVFDEYPHLARTAPQAPSMIQKFIDVDVEGTESMVVICGSSAGMMQSEIRSAGNPLHGRFENRLEIGEMPLSETRGFHKKMSAKDSLKVYMTVGGVPKYHRLMSEATYKECVIKCFISDLAPLRDEASSVVSGELSPASAYLSAVSRIGGGSAKQSEIADKMGVSRVWCKRCLDGLEEMGVVERIHPMLGAPKAPAYRIRDDLVAFNFEVLQRNAVVLHGAASDGQKYSEIKPHIDAFLRKRFEALCGKYVDANYVVVERGKWWERAKPGGAGSDIDVVAKVYGGPHAASMLACECKFSKDLMGLEELDALERRAEALGASGARYALFSLSGFEQRLEERAEARGIELVDGKRLLGG